MESNRIRFIEHLATNCPLSLEDFCLALQQKLGLPNFEFDFENETEWGLVDVDGIEYNISRPYEQDTLMKWDNTVLVGCNFGISLAVSDDLPQEQNLEWSSTELVPKIGQLIADLYGETVYHHRTWLGVGRNLSQKSIFYPKSV